MKRFAFLGCIAAALLSFVGCDETGKDGYEGINYIYLLSEGDKTTILESDQTPLSVEVMLTTALEEDLTVAFAVNGTEGVVELQNNPVTIKAGEKTASFEIVSLNAGKLSEAANFTVALDAAAVLPENMELKSPFAFVVNPAPATGELTAEQQAIIDAYKAVTGIDLSKYLGTVSVSTVVTGTDPDTYEPLEPQPIEGKTVIELSEKSTAEVPVLKMISNPMGIQDYMYGVFKARTVGNADWHDEDNVPCYRTLMNAINWTETSSEIFGMSLDGVSVGEGGELSYVAEYAPDPEYPEDLYIHVPFEFTYTAYDREKEVVESLKEKDPDWAYDCTSNPFFFLNNDDITEDWFSDEEEGLVGCWVETTGAVTNTSMVFTFCMYTCDLDVDYTRVVATYTPNN